MACSLASLFVALAAMAEPSAGTAKDIGVVVSYRGIDEKSGAAIARVVSAARSSAIEKYGFDLPETIRVDVQLDGRGHTRLFNDGNDRLFLTVKSPQDLRPPKDSGVFVLYGLCHELGHLAMYRPIKDRDWMTTAAAEGWAHYIGSRLVDDVYERVGADVWPDAYDYRADGMKRLEKQFTGRTASAPTVQGARLWHKLNATIGEHAWADLFAAWGKSKVDPAQPTKVLREALAGLPKSEAAIRWWADAQKTLVMKREASSFAAQTVKPADLAQKPIELARDDDKPAAKKSIAGSGHAVAFDAGGDGWHLTSVRLFGSRYGAAKPPAESFKITLCDETFQRIADFQAPYSTFQRGDAKWVTIPMTPTRVPAKFIICVTFNPTATNGVFLHHDAATEGGSLTGLPGEKPSPFQSGDWLLRATLDQPKSADALR
jgi:hypothetical protein